MNRHLERTELWKLHPRADYFLAHGGDLVPPPMSISMVVTNKCNLRCEICGSQKMLDLTKTPRTHMALDTFKKVGEVLFPLVQRVELNSQGDPLLNPDILAMFRLVNDYKTHYRVQTNGTLFTDELIEFFAESYGEISMSIDAVGPLFDEVRRNGVWAKAEPQIRKLCSRIKRDQVALSLYPTVTARTVGNMLDIVKWANDIGIEHVVFHNFFPFSASFEKVAEPAELQQSIDAIMNWYAKEDPATRTSFETRCLGKGRLTQRSFANKDRSRFVGTMKTNRPMPVEEGYPDIICNTPNNHLEIGMQGQIYACCRAQISPLGFATSVEEFTATWLGPTYGKLRHSLRRDTDGIMPLADCVGCINYLLPGAYAHLRAAKPQDPIAFTFDDRELLLTAINLENATSKCFRSPVRPGLDPQKYELWEDQTILPGREAPVDLIRKTGGGHWRIEGNIVLFSTSDNSNPLRNDRSYFLRRRETTTSA